MAGLEGTMRQAVRLEREDILGALSAWTGIPGERLAPGRVAPERLEELAAGLKGRVFGQDRAIDAAVAAIERRLQLPERPGVRRPMWVAVFAGPSGVGKTQLARELAAHFFGDGERRLVKIDCSELGEEHTIARLVGAPPGYVGHGDGGELTDGLRRCRTGVLLLDEIEKAHPRILTQIVLPLIGDGVVHDMNNGRALDVTSMMVVMTSNLGTNRQAEEAIGFVQGRESEHQATMRAVREFFPREVLGRVDDVTVFAPLSVEAVRQLWAREAETLGERLARRDVPCRVVIDPAAETLIVENLLPSVRREGARAVRRAFEKRIETPCLQLLRSGPAAGQTLRVERTGEDGLRYSVGTERDAGDG